MIGKELILIEEDKKKKKTIKATSQHLKIGIGVKIKVIMRMTKNESYYSCNYCTAPNNDL